MPRRQWLAYYAERLPTVEINSSFYHLPDRRVFEGWRRGTPDGFLFSVKASRYITHFKKLDSPQPALSRFLENARGLGPKLGPVLFQLPPRWGINLPRLEEFLGQLPAGFRYAFEFRDTRWFDPRTFRLMSRHGAAFCIYHLRDVTSPREVTAGFVYVRLHGPAGAYAGLYDEPALAAWAARLSGWAARGLEVFCYFDNDQLAHAVRNALRLRQMTAAGNTRRPEAIEGRRNSG